MLYRKWMGLCLICVMLAVFLAPTGLAQMSDPYQAYVQAVGDVNIRKEPDIESDIIGYLRLGEEAEYTGESIVDDRGIAWYGIIDGENTGWVSSVFSALITLDQEDPEEASLLSNYPHYYGGYIFELSGYEQAREDGKMANGCNDEGEITNWIINLCCVELNEEGGFHRSGPAPELVYCSWDDDVEVCGGGNFDAGWDMLKEGHTLQETERIYWWPAGVEINADTAHLYLPDDPDIAGHQKLVYLTRYEVLFFDFELSYNGGYSGKGMGWELFDVKISKFGREEFEKIYQKLSEAYENEQIN